MMSAEPNHSEMLKELSAKIEQGHDALHSRINALGQQTQVSLGQVSTELALLRERVAANQTLASTTETRTQEISRRLLKIETERSVWGGILNSAPVAWLCGLALAVVAYFSHGKGGG